MVVTEQQALGGNKMKVIGKCIVCGQELVEAHIELGYCDECTAPVGKKAWEKYEKAERGE